MWVPIIIFLLRKRKIHLFTYAFIQWTILDDWMKIFRLNMQVKNQQNKYQSISKKTIHLWLLSYIHTYFISLLFVIILYSVSLILNHLKKVSFTQDHWNENISLNDIFRLYLLLYISVLNLMTIGPQFKSYIRSFYIEKKEKKQHTKTRIMVNEKSQQQKKISWKYFTTKKKNTEIISRCWCSIAICRISTLSSTCCWWWYSWRCWYSRGWLLITITRCKLNKNERNIFLKKCILKYKNKIINLNISNLPWNFFLLKNFLFLFPLRSNNFCEIRIYQRKKQRETRFFFWITKPIQRN